MKARRGFWIMMAWMAAGGTVALAKDTFTVKKVDFLDREPKDDLAIYELPKEKPKGQKYFQAKDFIFVPCLMAEVETSLAVQSAGVFARAYFYDEKGVLLRKLEKPENIYRRKDFMAARYALPALLEKGKEEKIFFRVPKEVEGKSWTALVVFGDAQEADAKFYPKAGEMIVYEYPEKKLVEEGAPGMVERKPAIDPLVEEVIKTKNPQQPQITIFLRPPSGINQGSGIKGVLALCLLGNNVEDIRQKMSGNSGPMLRFADANKLAVIAWGKASAWAGIGKDYFELDRGQAKLIDDSFDEVAEAWEYGVEKFARKYGLPDRNFLLWGASGAANWAHRLALRKPQYFAAVHVEILSSYDKPTAEGKDTMWLLTTGELEPGYEASKRFYKDCRNLGYPFLYKAYPRLGHSGCAQATALGEQFFRFALERIEVERQLQIPPFEDPAAYRYQKRMEAFKRAPFYGDIVNQELFPAAEMEMIPEGFRVALPNKTLADLWNKN